MKICKERVQKNKSDEGFVPLMQNPTPADSLFVSAAVQPVLLTSFTADEAEHARRLDCPLGEHECSSSLVS